MEGIKDKIEKNGMIISRIPQWIKQIIINEAIDRHCDDYGEAISQFIREAIEYRRLKEKFLNDDFFIQMKGGCVIKWI